MSFHSRAIWWRSAAPSRPISDSGRPGRGGHRGEQVGEVAAPAHHRGAVEEVGAVLEAGDQRVALEVEASVRSYLAVR